MLEFLIGAAAATVASNKLKNKSKDDIKKMINTGLDITGKVVSASVEVITDRVNDKLSSSFDEPDKQNNNKNDDEVTMSKM